MNRVDLLHDFPEAWFFDDLAPLPDEGTWGFELCHEDPEAIRFFRALLECLWRNREDNELFRLFQKYPWNRPPHPAFRYIRHIPWEQRTEEDQRLLAELQTQFVDGLTNAFVRATPDYLVGWVYPSVRSLFSHGHPDNYIMPLGYVTAESSFASSEGGCSLFVKGIDQNGTPLTLTFDWYDTETEGYEEARFFVRFIQAMRFKVSGYPPTRFN